MPNNLRVRHGFFIFKDENKNCFTLFLEIMKCLTNVFKEYFLEKRKIEERENEE